MNDPSATWRIGPPVPPTEPEPWECCGGGCEPCVYDRYWEALTRYEEALKAWEARDKGPSASDDRSVPG